MDRRRFHKIKYPNDCRPELAIRLKDGEEIRKCEVEIINEKEIALTGKELSVLEPMKRIDAQILFSDGEALDIEGELWKIGEDRAVICLSEEIPASRIKKEQILLRD